MTWGQLAGTLCAPQLRAVIHWSGARGCVQAAQQGGTSSHRDLAQGSEIEHMRACTGAEQGNVDIRGFSMEITGVSSLPPPCERPHYVLLRFVFLATSVLYFSCLCFYELCLVSAKTTENSTGLEFFWVGCWGFSVDFYFFFLLGTMQRVTWKPWFQ